MKILSVILFFFFSFHAQAMGKSVVHKYVEDICFVSRVVHKLGNFSALKFRHNNFRPWLANSIEPFHQLIIFGEKSFVRTSPVTRVNLKNNEFIIHTLSGSIYHVSKDKFIFVDGLDYFKSIFEIAYNYAATETYIRLEISKIKEDMRVGRGHKQWLPYDSKHEQDIFILTKKLKQLKEGESLSLYVPTMDEMKFFLD